MLIKDLPALVQHELQHPLHNLQGVIRLLGTGRFGQLSQEGSQLLNTAMANLDRLTRLAVAVEEQPAALTSMFSDEQIRLFQLKQDLPGAIAQKAIYLVYQPIVCTRSQQVVGFEALARWEHPTYGPISPTLFIPIAEESGLIHEMGKYLIEQACFQLRRWQHDNPALTISVNLSALQLSQLDLADHIGRVLLATQIAPENLKLEITESTLIENSEVVGIVLKKLRELGVQLYLDDFGTGYSSLSRLPSLPLDALKVDRSFVTNQNWDICEVILALACKLSLNVIVEGIETAEEAQILEEIGFHYMQGYFFSHPVSVQDASQLLIESNSSQGLILAAAAR